MMNQQSSMIQMNQQPMPGQGVFMGDQGPASDAEPVTDQLRQWGLEELWVFLCQPVPSEWLK